MKKFEIGKTYNMRSACNHDCIWSYTVTNRTACTITLKDNDTNKIHKCRVSKLYSEMDGREVVLPLGNYSMAPMLRA
jgi:hypothetical protein